MAIQWDTRDDTLWFKGRKIGEISKADADGKVTVTFSVSYSCSSADAHLPIMALASALSAIPDYQATRPAADLTITLPEDSIAETFDVPRLLEEKTIKVAGYMPLPLVQAGAA